MCGASDIGQGSDTMLALIVAEALGLNPDRIVVTTSDTDLSPVDLGAYSSRVTFMCGLACKEAAETLASRVRDVVAAELKVPSSELMAADGRWFSLRDPKIGLSCADAFAAAEAALGPSVRPGAIERIRRKAIAWGPSVQCGGFAHVLKLIDIGLNG